MAKLVFAMNQSLDGYVDHMKIGPPGPILSRHFLEHIRTISGHICGRTLYEIMSYWDDDQPDWDDQDHEFAAAWRSVPKWVVSRALKSVGPNATLIADNVESAIRKLKSDLSGEIDVGGPNLVQSLSKAGLIDEYRIYLHPIVTGGGNPFFPAPPPPLHLIASDQLGEDIIRLTYVPT